MRAIFKHELSSHFTGLTGYVFGAFLLLFTGIFTLAVNLVRYSVTFEYVFSGMSFIFLIIVPVLTMRALSEERRQKTDQLLYSLPISMTDVVVGKYLAMLVVFAVPMLIICLYPLVLSSFGPVNLLKSYSAIAGFFCIGAALIAMGTFVSSVTENQATSAGLCFVVMLINYYVGDLANFVSSTPAASLLAVSLAVILVAIIIWRLTKNVTVALGAAVVLEGATLAAYLTDSTLFEGLFPNFMKTVSLYNRFNSLLMGSLDITTFVYYISVTVLMLFLSVQAMEKRRWSE